MYHTIEKLKARIDRDLENLEAREIEAMPREQKERELAEAGIDFPALYKRIQDTLAHNTPTTASSGSRVWIIPNARDALREIGRALMDALAVPAVPQPASGLRGKSAPSPPTRPETDTEPETCALDLPEGIPLPPEDLLWIPEHFQSIAEEGVIEMTLRYRSSGTPPSQPPSVTVHINGEPRKARENYDPNGTLELTLRGRLPEENFNWRMESHFADQIAIHIDSVPTEA